MGTHTRPISSEPRTQTLLRAQPHETEKISNITRLCRILHDAHRSLIILRVFFGVEKTKLNSHNFLIESYQIYILVSHFGKARSIISLLSAQDTEMVYLGIATDCNIEERRQSIAAEKSWDNQLMRDEGQQH
jgi:hypothetical protein